MEKVTSDKVMGDELGGRSLKNDKDRRQESEFRSQKLRITRFVSRRTGFATEAQRTQRGKFQNPNSKFQGNIQPDGRLWKASEPWGSLKSEVQGPKEGVI